MRRELGLPDGAAIARKLHNFVRGGGKLSDGFFNEPTSAVPTETQESESIAIRRRREVLMEEFLTTRVYIGAEDVEAEGERAVELFHKWRIDKKLKAPTGNSPRLDEYILDTITWGLIADFATRRFDQVIAKKSGPSEIRKWSRIIEVARIAHRIEQKKPRTKLSF